MSTVTGKQQERMAREERILGISRAMLIRDGYHGLNMDRIARQLRFSKGTIYNHFSCKEEIIIALAIETMEVRTDLFSRAAAFAGIPRERLMAVGCAAELFVRLYPDHFKVEHIIRSSGVWEKTSEQRRNVMRSCETRCVGMVAGIVRDAIARGDVTLPADVTPEDLVFGLWSLTYGAFSISATSESLHELGVRDAYAAVRDHSRRLLDGYGWKPLSTEFNNEQLMDRVRDEVFANEFQRIADGTV